MRYRKIFNAIYTRQLISTHFMCYRIFWLYQSEREREKKRQEKKVVFRRALYLQSKVCMTTVNIFYS